MKSIAAGLATLAVLLAAGEAHAQAAWTDRVWGFVDGGYLQQPARSSFTASWVSVFNVENGTLSSVYPVKKAPRLDAGVGARLWNNFGLGVATSYATETETANVNGHIPHPFFYNQLRPISGQKTGLKREELDIHVQALYMVPVADQVQIGVYGGPSFFLVKQDLVTAVDYTASYPFDTAIFSSADAARQSKNGVGLNAAVDVTYLFGSSGVGVGAAVRYSRATIKFDNPDATALSVDIGGTEVSAGLRLRF